MNYDIVFQQYITITLLIMIGFFLARKHIFSPKTVGELAVFLLKGITPLIVFENMVLNPSNLELNDFLGLFLMSLMIVILGYGLSLLFKIKDPLKQFAIIFSNSGFVGIPLVTSFIGGQYVPYIIPFIIAQTLLVWTLGVLMISDSMQDVNLKNVLRNPAVFSFFISIGFILLKITVPESLSQTVKMLSSLNTPIAMIILGTYVAGIDMEMMTRFTELVFVSVMKLLIVPLVSLGVLKFLPISDVKVLLTLLIVIACPTGTTAAMFSQIYGKDPVFSASIVSVTTLLSLFTIPLLLLVAQSVL